MLIYCDPACEPEFKVYEIKLFDQMIVSLNGRFYNLPGNEFFYSDMGNDAEKVFGTGSYICDCTPNDFVGTCYYNDCAYFLNPGTDDWSLLGIEFEQPAVVSEYFLFFPDYNLHPLC